MRALRELWKKLTSLFRRKKYKYIEPKKVKVVSKISCKDCRYAKMMTYNDMRGMFCTRPQAKKEAKILEEVDLPYFPTYAKHDICRKFVGR